MNTVNYNDAEQLFGAVGTSLKKHAAEIADIVNVYGAKNLIPYPYYRPSGYTSGNMTGTYDANGVITINKTADTITRYFALYNGEPFLLPNTTYTLSLELTNATNTSVYVANGVGAGLDMAAIRNKATGKYDVTFTTPSTFDDNLIIGLYYGKDTVETNAIVKVMIRLASIQDDTYVPYVPTNKELMSCKVNGELGAKNLLLYPYYETTKTSNGVTFTDNGDGTITVNGTASGGNAIFLCVNYQTESQNLFSNIEIDAPLMFTGCPSGGSSDTYHIQIAFSVGSGAWQGGGIDTGSGKLCMPISGQTHYHIYTCRIIVKEGTTLNNALFKPMLRLASDTDPTWQPYAKTNKELTDDIASLAARIKAIEDVNHLTWG